MQTHGKSNTKLYRKFAGMKQRCFNKNDDEYRNYGGRGITICDEWLKDFNNFYDWALRNGYEDGLTIERIDCNGNYEPSNCCFIPMERQSNNRRNNVLAPDGESTLADISRTTGIRYGTIQMRHARGLPIEAELYKREKPVVRDDGAIYPSIAAAARINDVSEGRIRDVCYGRRMRTVGHGFSFLTREAAEAALEGAGG